MPKPPNQNNQDINLHSPSQILDTVDPGDAVQRAFRYQHGYGVILLLAGVTGQKPYKAVWCEHHEDLLCERNDNLFDAFQIKTQQPENGYWTLKDEPFRKSVKRFVQLLKSFKDHICELSFVSNTNFLNVGLEVKDHRKLSRSPRRFFTAISEASSIQDIQAPFNKSFVDLREYCECSDNLLFETLKRIRLVLGPDLRSFDTEISHTHLTKLEECRTLDHIKLNQIRDELIQRVYYASSLYCDNPKRHWYCLDRNPGSNPELLAKKIEIEIVQECIKDYKNIPFRYSPELSETTIKSFDRQFSILKLKMLSGGLAGQFITMQRRTLSTEQRLLELQYSKPDDFGLFLNQLECVVKGECDEAQLKASLLGAPYGARMLHDVYERLRSLSKDEPEKVENQPYECLVGMAGLLTEDCKVWWSEEFDLGGTA